MSKGLKCVWLLGFTFSIFYSDDEPPEPPTKKRKVAFTVEEERELDEHFQLQLATRNEMPSTTELQDFS